MDGAPSIPIKEKHTSTDTTLTQRVIKRMQDRLESSPSCFVCRQYYENLCGYIKRSCQICTDKEYNAQNCPLQQNKPRAESLDIFLHSFMGL